jgi:hypothetical protein
MTRARAKRLERDLLLERERLQREIERLTTPPSDASEARGRFGDDEVTSTAGNSAEVDDALAVRAARELDDVDRALVQSVCHAPHSSRRIPRCSASAARTERRQRAPYSISYSAMSSRQ